MPGTHDIINQLVEQIESQNHNYVFALIKPKENDSLHDEIEIFTNIRDEPLDKLLRVLREKKKNLSLKIKNESK